MSRYKIIEDSQSAHCCFGYTVVDTTKPVSIHGELYQPNGVQEYEEVCETFFKEEAELICEALNFYAEYHQ